MLGVNMKVQQVNYVGLIKFLNLPHGIELFESNIHG